MKQELNHLLKPAAAVSNLVSLFLLGPNQRIAMGRWASIQGGDSHLDTLQIS